MKIVNHRTVPWFSDTRTDEKGEKLRTTQLGLEIIGDTAYNYEYDKVGNITTIHKGVCDGTGSTAAATCFETYRSYEYDGLNQLTREIDLSQGKKGNTGDGSLC